MGDGDLAGRFQDLHLHSGEARSSLSIPLINQQLAATLAANHLPIRAQAK